MNTSNSDLGHRASTDVILSFRKQVTAAVGESGYQLMYMWAASFISIYYTDVIGVSLGAVSLLLFIVRLFDAVNDPLMGIILDRTRTRWGRYRPWVLVGGVLLAILMVLLFNANPEWGYTQKVVWMYALYILVTIAATICATAYQAMIGVLTSNGQQRGSIAGKKMMFTNLSIGIVGMFAVDVIAKMGGSNIRQGYFLTVLMACVVGLPIFVSSAIFSKEVVTPVSKSRTVAISKLLSTMFRNLPMMTVTLGFFLLGFSSYGRATMYTYYFSYYVGDFSMYGTFALVNMIGGITGALCASSFSKLVTNKGKTAAGTLAICSVLFGMMYFFAAPSPIYFVLIFVFAIFNGFTSATLVSMVPDCVDYGEYKHGIRSDGFLAAFVSFSMKFGGAVGPAVILAILGMIGFVPNEVPSTEVSNMINASVSMIPAGLYIVMSAMIFFLYKLDRDTQKNIVLELDKRRRESEEI